MRYRFAPEHPGAIAYASASVMVRRGDVVELTDAQCARLTACVAGVDGAPCLIPVDSAAEAVADFMAAISTPTDCNPETPPPAVSVDAEPVKRTRRRKGDA